MPSRSAQGHDDTRSCNTTCQTKGEQIIMATNSRKRSVNYPNDERDVAVYHYLLERSKGGYIEHATIQTLANDLGHDILSTSSTLEVKFTTRLKKSRVDPQVHTTKKEDQEYAMTSLTQAQVHQCYDNNDGSIEIEHSSTGPEG